MLKLTYDEDERNRIGCAILAMFFGLLFLLFFQLGLHLSQTKDLQRRVGQLEQQVNR